MTSISHRLVVWRHGRTTWNQDGRFQGRSDVPLSDAGLDEAAVAARAVAKLEPAALLSSDATRARQTALALADRCGLRPVLDPRLREADLGGWEGLTRDEAAERFPEEFAAWREGTDACRGGGESPTAVAARAYAAVADALVPLDAGQTLVAVTHGATARAVIGRLLGLDPPAWRQLCTLGHGRWAVLEQVPFGWRLAEFNARNRRQ
jgi:glucosyl-3-phosphoglycerate phosphatase